MLIALTAVIAASFSPPLLVPATSPPVAACTLVAADGEEALQELVNEWNEARKAHQAALRAAKDDPDEQRALRGQAPNAEDYVPRFLALAKEYAKTETAAGALAWVAANSRQEKTKRQAFETLIDEHVESPLLGDLCGSLERDYLDGPGLLGTILEANPHRDVKASACLTLGRNLKDAAEIAEGLKAGMEEQYLGWYGEDVVRVFSEVDAGALADSAVEHLSRVVEEFGDVKNSRNVLLKDTAAGDLFELQNLWFGMVAPEIEAEDIDGVVFKLSDYRGKVIVLDFWGNW